MLDENNVDRNSQEDWERDAERDMKEMYGRHHYGRRHEMARQLLAEDKSNKQVHQQISSLEKPIDAKLPDHHPMKEMAMVLIYSSSHEGDGNGTTCYFHCSTMVLQFVLNVFSFRLLVFLGSSTLFIFASCSRTI